MRSAMPGQQSEELQHILASQDASPQIQDFSRWHKVCESFLIRTIQRRTEADINKFTSSNTDMRRHLVKQLEEGIHRGNITLWDFNLTTSPNTQIQKPPLAFPRHNLQLGQLSTTSGSSMGSIASQVSDSSDNYVQQSSRILLRSVLVVMFQVRPRSMVKRLFAKALALLGGATKEAQEAHTLLFAAICSLEKVLLDFEPEMHSIGFPDVAFKIDIYENLFSENVTKFFEIVRREKSHGMQALWKRLDDKKGPWKPWKGHEHRSLHSWRPWHEYGYLQLSTSHVEEKVREILEAAVATRDSFIVAACSMINEVVLDFARELSIEVHDKVEDGVLMEREFERPHGDHEDNIGA